MHVILVSNDLVIFKIYFYSSHNLFVFFACEANSGSTQQRLLNCSIQYLRCFVLLFWRALMSELFRRLFLYWPSHPLPESDMERVMASAYGSGYDELNGILTLSNTLHNVSPWPSICWPVLTQLFHTSVQNWLSTKILTQIVSKVATRKLPINLVLSRLSLFAWCSSLPRLSAAEELRNE